MLQFYKSFTGREGFREGFLDKTDFSGVEARSFLKASAFLIIGLDFS